ncbi:sulfite dehydrogenase subunit SoeA [Allochromatium vinosum]|uniref:Sulfite dehydrogenase subunit A n=1 Tax=Allochromatium vinosum (strain ATCC 17899 / DSM 180 / NBRC 103801 / NCIMB 10441 / D) TaxID=572477 RepID=SOEA_ALLVD|nr:sulfite dehydrogenase subunit SoeA [Allochromatium vinosum]D3RNN8.1 RecName: Full=Sulfite dehydrogenase subunit A; AltName: Full=Sulfite dehydrogenase molybdopterin subunit; AltName: Full=Sulfite-oxidizing enzyme subunit A [Allochromatium vinosum DSM 180]ADC63403.1 molybdopterin oxidoreductase [Allochromatium vinosum DSM 180]
MQDPASHSDSLVGRVEVKETTCYMCACRCGIRVHLRDGEVRYIDGNPNHPLNKGVICAKGSSGIMKQYSPGRLTQPLRRKAGAERGESAFEVISWDEAFAMLEERLAKLRAEDPKKFALFTGRDQMQALTGLFAKQYGTPNYAAHGGFCSVNMAAGLIYTIGGSFWEFGGPDLERAKLFVMIGTAEDHHSNPLKMAISEFKRRGGRFISVNPVRTGYSAVADEWVPIKPGTDGALLLAITREILDKGLFDRDFLVRYTNAAELVIDDPSRDDHGLFYRAEMHVEPDCFDPQNKLWWDRDIDGPISTHTPGADPRLMGRYVLPDGTPVKPSFQLLKERLEQYTPEWAAPITGIPADTIRRLAHEMGVMARDQKIELPIKWTDCWDDEHESVTGNPVAFHAMRGLAAHSNGFQTIRALGVLMTVLGTIDRPGGFRHKAPYPRPIPPCPKPPHGPEAVQPNTPLDGMPLGWPSKPEDLFVDAEGEAVRLDKAFSWEYPLSVHGLMHNVITNAWRGDPYPIDTLFLFMANMAWNSTMNTVEVRKMLVDKHPNGDYKIPFLVVCDTFASETVAFADLVLPDTSYLERHDVLSMLDRPISEFDGPVDSVRIPVLPPKGECKPFQEVLVELGSRLKLPAFTNADGSRKYRNYPDFIVNYETSPGSGIGFLAGWRGKGGDQFLKGEPNPHQWEMYAQNNCVYHHELPRSYQYMRNWNKGYLHWARAHGMIRYAEPITLHLYSEVLQRFRLAAQGKRPGRQPPERLRQRVETYFDPLPFYYEPLESRFTDTQRYPLNALTQRPMAMYHSWDSQNAWLRQIHSHNYLFLSPKVGLAQGFADGDWVWVESPHGKVRCMCRFSEAVEPGTVWTWNAIGKGAGAWGLAPNADEARKGFLLNHVIAEELPAHEAGEHLSNSDPVTGQAAWFDVRVRVYKAEAGEPEVTSPQFKPMPRLPGQEKKRGKWQAYVAGIFGKQAS